MTNVKNLAEQYPEVYALYPEAIRKIAKELDNRDEGIDTLKTHIQKQMGQIATLTADAVALRRELEKVP